MKKENQDDKKDGDQEDNFANMLLNKFKQATTDRKIERTKTIPDSSREEIKVTHTIEETKKTIIPPNSDYFDTQKVPPIPAASGTPLRQRISIQDLSNRSGTLNKDLYYDKVTPSKLPSES